MHVAHILFGLQYPLAQSAFVVHPVVEPVPVEAPAPPPVLVPVVPHSVLHLALHSDKHVLIVVSAAPKAPDVLAVPEPVVVLSAVFVSVLCCAISALGSGRFTFITFPNNGARTAVFLGVTAVIVGVLVGMLSEGVGAVAVIVGVLVGMLNEGVAASSFAMHLHEVQLVPLVQSAFAVHSCGAASAAGSAVFQKKFARVSVNPAAAAIELTKISATITESIAFVFIL